jgi:hypothetical protein
MNREEIFRKYMGMGDRAFNAFRAGKITREELDELLDSYKAQFRAEHGFKLRDLWIPAVIAIALTAIIVAVA